MWFETRWRPLDLRAPRTRLLHGLSGFQIPLVAKHFTNKVEFTLRHAIKVHRRSRIIVLIFNLGVRWGLVVNSMPRLVYPPGMTCYRLYRRLGGPQGRVWKIALSPEFDPRTVQPIASRYPGPKRLYFLQDTETGSEAHSRLLREPHTQ